MSQPDSDVLLLLDGEEPSEQLLQQLSNSAKKILATDGAASYAKKYNIKLDAIIGDMDSISDDIKTYFIQIGTILVRDSDQQSNDFEKAIRFILREYSAMSLIIVGLPGKRLDHQLTNISVLCRYRDYFESVECFDNYQQHQLLTTKYPQFNLAGEGTLSLFPLPSASGIVTEGLLYPLINETLEIGKREGQSNKIISVPAFIKISAGALLVSFDYIIGK